ncbi:MAG TPA: 2'-5' RNA ligase family protein [Amnibacterium sp.]|jgi:2'-5' RNA ligase|nr:2'-5' RNA ligase family protein [Amnibacterium sp.]
MVQSVELLLEPDAERRVRGEWAALADAGLPSLATHHAETNRPHVTLAVAEAGLEAAVDALGAVFRGWHLAERGLPVVVGSPVLFGGHRSRWVLARLVVPSRPLITLHSAVHRAVDGAAPDAEVVDQTRPDGWTPHVSLARRVTTDRLGEALSRFDASPIPCRVIGARLWDSTPKTVTDLC